jgi:hypothetical protein
MTEAETKPTGNNTPPIDPTKNVLDLVAAESRYRDAMRIADEKLQNAMRDAETRRLNELAEQKSEFDRTQASILRTQVADNATLLSSQLDRITTTLSERIAKLEQFRYESSGRGLGAAAVISYIIAAVGFVSTVAVLLVKFKTGV